MALEPRQLKAFLAIVHTGSLGRAAQTLHLTQPALSRVVKQMENQLRVQLFERRTTGMELTTFGKALLPYATHLTEEADLAIEEINVRLGLGRGTLRIGTVGSAAMVVLPSLVDRFQKQWPNLQLQITEAVEDKLAAALVNNDVDVVLSGPIAETEEIMQVCEHRFSDRSVVIASASHPLHERRKVALADLLELPWAMPSSDAEPRRLFDALIHQLGAKPPRIAVETRSPSYDQGGRGADADSRLAARATVRGGAGRGTDSHGPLRRAGDAAAFLRLSPAPQLHGAAAAAVPAGLAEVNQAPRSWMSGFARGMRPVRYAPTQKGEHR